MTSKEAIAQIDEYLLSVETLLDNQPPGNNLDMCDQFMRELNVLYARWAQVDGLASSQLAAITHFVISSMSDEEYKKIKHSSTLVLQYTLGKYDRKSTASLQAVHSLGSVLKSVSDNYRSLISSYRLERELSAREVRQTVQN